jgi:phosphoribosylcarboxyaminoimidazole (NCAIR) mutase
MRDLEHEYSNADDLEKMCSAHNELIKTIIDKEEDLISAHRMHID